MILFLDLAVDTGSDAKHNHEQTSKREDGGDNEAHHQGGSNQTYQNIHACPVSFRSTTCLLCRNVL